jgi:hypothetical protein
MVFPFERLRDRLLTAGVSPRHVRRYMAELADHFDDLEAAAKSSGNARPQESALERLGSPDDLARAMIVRSEFRAWTARAPWAVFLFGPAALLAIIDAIPLLLGVIVAFVGAQRRMRPLWPLAGLVAISVIAGLNYLHVDVPLAPGQHGEISLGASVGQQTAVRAMSSLIISTALYFSWRRAFGRRSALVR